MKRKVSSLNSLLTLGILSVMISSNIYADEKIVTTQMNGGSISWAEKVSGGTYMMRVTGPDNFLFEQTFKGTAPSITSFGADGQYRYEITAIPVLSKDEKRTMRTARKNNTEMTAQYKTGKQSGYFYVKDGFLISNNLKEKRNIK